MYTEMTIKTEDTDAAGGGQGSLAQKWAQRSLMGHLLERVPPHQETFVQWHILPTLSKDDVETI